MLEYHVSARRIDSHGSEATAKDARIFLDADMAGRVDAFNPAEMLLAVDTDESDARLDLLHRNLQKYGTIYDTLAEATDVSGTIRRKA